MSARTAALVTGAGLALAAAVPPWGWWPTAFVGMALVDRLLAGQPATVRFRRAAAVTVVWLLPAMLWMLDLTPPGWLIAVALHAVFFGLAAAAVPAGRGRRPALVATWTVAEFVRWSWPFGGVPLATLAHGQAAGPLAPVVRVGGPLLLVALVVAVGVGLSALADGRQADRASVWAVVGATLAVVVASALSAVAPTGHAVDELDVAVVQGGGPQRTRASTTGAARVFAAQLEADDLVDRAVDVVLWPENVVNPEPDPGDGPRLADTLYPDDALDALTAEARRLDAVLIPGWFHEDPDDLTANVNYQTAIEPSGEVVDRYDKVRTVPFGEFVPLRSLIDPFARGMLPARDTKPGSDEAVLRTSAGDFGVVISWEVFFEHRARDAVRDGAEVLLNPTNGASYWLTILQGQQIASSRLRAIETGRWVLQAAPTGYSAVIDPAGRVLQRTGVSEQAVLHATIERRHGTTWPVRFGVWPMLAVCLVLFAAARSPLRRPTCSAGTGPFLQVASTSGHLPSGDE